MLFKNRKYKKLRERVESILVNYPEIYKYFFSEFELFHSKLRYFKNPEGKYSTNLHPYDPIIDRQRNDFDDFLYGFIGTEVSKKADERHQELIEINKPINKIRWEIYDLKKKGVHYFDDTEPKTNIYLNFLEYTSIFAWKLNGILEEIENYDKEAQELNQDYSKPDFSESKNQVVLDRDDKTREKNIQKALDIKQNLIDNKLTVRIIYGGLWEAKFQFNEAFKNYGESAEFLEHSMIYKQETEPFDHNDPENSDFIAFNKELLNNKNLKTYSGEIEICEVLKIPKENIIMALDEYISNPNDEISYEYTTWEDFLTQDWDYPEFSDTDIDDCTLGYNGPRIADCLLGLRQGSAGGNVFHYIQKTWNDEKEDKIELNNLKDIDNILDFNDVRVLVKQLKEKKSTIKIRSLWMNYCDYQLLKENSLYEQSNRGFFSKEIVSWTEGNFSHSFENNFDPKKLVFTGQISIIEEKKIQSKEIIDSMFLYIKECENPKDNYDIKYDYSFNDYKDWYFLDIEDDYIGWLSDEIYIVKPSDQLNFSLEKDFNLNLDRYSDIVSFTSCETNIKSLQHTLLVNEPKNETKNLKLVKKEDNSKEEIPKNAKKINNEKDLIQELGRIHEILGHKEYKKEAYNLWRDFFLKKYDESEEKDGWEIGQEANSVMFDMYEVDFVSFFHNNKDFGDTEVMNIRFPFKFLENGKAALIYNFPFKYDQITSHSSGSFYQLDDVWGSLNEVCKSLSELELLDFNKLSQNDRFKLFKPKRDDY